MYSQGGYRVAGTNIYFGSPVIGGGVNSIAIGDATTEAQTGADTNFGESVVIGIGAKGKKWRDTVIGFKCDVRSVSGAGLGCGVVILESASHGLGLGRGAYVNEANSPCIGFAGGDGLFNVYFDNSHTAKYIDYEGSTVTRTSAHNIYLNGMSGYDETGGLTNQAGGGIYVIGGRGTGTAIGGPAGLGTTRAGASGNTKNSVVIMFDVRGLALGASDTPAFIWHGGLGAMRQITLAAASGGFQALRVAST